MPSDEAPESPYIEKIVSLLGRIPARVEPGKGLVVNGNGLEALQRSHALFSKKGDAPKSVSIDDDVTLVFFTRPAGVYVHHDAINRDGNDIKISYHLVQHLEKITTCHLALIPLGKLSAGAYDVDFVRLPDTVASNTVLPQLEKGFEKGIVCKPFSFKVTRTGH